MRTKITFFLLVLSMLLSTGAITKESKGVVVTIKPLYSLVMGVMGKTGKAELLLSGNTSPHNFHLKPSQIKSMQGAHVLFYIDDSFETFLAGAFEVLPKHIRKVRIAKKPGLTIFSYRKGGVWDTHKHNIHEHEKNGNRSHEKSQHKRELDDMHIWLDPENARKIVKSITKELSTIYPENQDMYKTNARGVIKRIDALDTKLKSELEKLRDEPFIVFHDAYQYFEHYYGLSSVGSITFEPDESPSPNRIRKIRKKLQETGAKCVLHEPQFSNRLINTVTEGTNAKSGMLDPLGVELEDGADLYFDLLNNLAKNLKICLG